MLKVFPFFRWSWGRLLNWSHLKISAMALLKKGQLPPLMSHHTLILKKFVKFL